MGPVDGRGVFVVVALSAALWSARPVSPSPAVAQTPLCFGQAATIVAEPGVVTVGTDGDDVIVGTSGPDVIRGGPGADLICGLGGDDVLRGNRGADRIRAGSGADELHGGPGSDVLVGKSGDDELFGKSGDDRLRGNRGRDRLRGGRGHDLCRGGLGENSVASCEAGDGVAPSSVDDLAFDSSGVLWATTGDGRTIRTGVQPGTPRHLYRFVGDAWHLVAQPEIVFDEGINWEIRGAAGGGIYVASSPTSTTRGAVGNGGVYLTDGLTWELFPQHFACGSLAVDSRGHLWATCPDFLTRLVDGRWQDVPEGTSAQSVAAGRDGSVWFTTFSRSYELLRYDGMRWNVVGPCADCSGPRSILGIDNSGGAWVARGGCGLDGLTRFDPSGSTSDVAIRGARDIAFASDGMIWIALPCDGASARGGVARLGQDDKVRRYTTADGLPDNSLQAVEISPDGDIYVGGEGGVSRYQPDTDTWVPVSGSQPG